MEHTLGVSGVLELWLNGTSDGKATAAILTD